MEDWRGTGNGRKIGKGGTGKEVSGERSWEGRGKRNGKGRRDGVENGRVEWWGGQGKGRDGEGEMTSCDGDCLGPAVACWMYAYVYSPAQAGVPGVVWSLVMHGRYLTRRDCTAYQHSPAPSSRIQRQNTETS